MFRKSLAIIGLHCLLLMVCGIAFAQSSDGVVRIEKRTHTVKKGEFAIDIAKECGIDVFTLKYLNPGRNMARLQIGDVVVVGIKKINSAAPATTQLPVKTDKTVKPAKPQKRPDKVALMENLEEKVPTAKKQGAPGTIWSFFLFIFKLGIVLLLAYLVILALKLLSDKRETSPRTRRDMKLVDTVKLSTTSSLHLVEVGGKKLLIGSSSGQVNLLREMEAVEDSKPSAEENQKFSEYLEKYSGAFQKTPAGRVAGLLRDCAVHLQSRKRTIGEIGATSADGDEKA